MPNKHPERLTYRWMHLFAALRQAVVESPNDVLAAIRGSPPEGVLPSPWETWLLLSLFEYRDRQLWACNLLRERLPEAVPPSARLRKRDQPIETYLPGSPEWELRLECGVPIFAVLHHRVTDEYIFADISALDEGRPLVFVECLARNAVSPEDAIATARLRQLCPWCDRRIGCRETSALDSLVRGGWLDEVHYEPVDANRNIEPDAHRLSELAVKRSVLVSDFLHTWRRTTDRLWLAALVGDWLLAEELAREREDQESIGITAERAEDCRKRRLDEIRRLIGSGPACTIDLHALDALGVEDVDRNVRRNLTLTDTSGQREVAVFLTELCNKPNWCEFIFDWLGKQCSSPERSGCECLFVTYLVKHAYRAAEALRLLADHYGEPSTAAMIALEYAPELASPHVYAALRGHSDSSEDETGMAELGRSSLRPLALVLANIDTPWAHRQLREALSDMESDAWTNRFRALPLVLALCESSSPMEPEDVAVWEHLYDREEFQEARRLFRNTMDDDKHSLPWLSSVPL